MTTKPCPFCGETEDLFVSIETGSPSAEGFPAKLTCGACGASGPWIYVRGNDGHAELLCSDQWNQRV